MEKLFTNLVTLIRNYMTGSYKVAAVAQAARLDGGGSNKTLTTT
jgi:hypothetical protein